MHDHRLTVPVFLAIIATVHTATASEPDTTTRFSLVVESTVSGLEQNSSVQVWCPEPVSSPLQQVSVTRIKAPADTTVRTEARYGNAIRHFAVDSVAGSPVRFRYEYHITRHAVVRGQRLAQPAYVPTAKAKLWLAPNRLVPVNAEPLQKLWPNLTAGSRKVQAKEIYDRVLGHVDYRKDKPGYGRGDTLWVCDSRFGNCTDFHSLFISLARSQQIPALFEIGLPLPRDPQSDHGDIGGYHCWAWFQTENDNWVPVDISEADKHPEQADFFFGNLPSSRVSLAVGRDITLEPPQAGPPLNFFVYPYCEVDGVAVPAKQITTKHSWHASPPVTQGRPQDGSS